MNSTVLLTLILDVTLLYILGMMLRRLLPATVWLKTRVTCMTCHGVTLCQHTDAHNPARSYTSTQPTSKTIGNKF